LPFLATEVAIDGVRKTLSPAADVAVFDVPPDSPYRHSLEAVALDGTRADGYAKEEGGIAQPEPGLSFDIPQPLATASTWTAASTTTPPPVRPRPKPGTTHNGFTKLK
jgi:hypothetical protein